MFDLLINGGWVLWLLALLSLISFANIAYVALRLRAVKLQSLSENPREIASAVLENTDNNSGCLRGRLSQQVAEIARDNPEPLYLREGLIVSAQRLMDDLRSGFRSLEIIAATAPLLGLLGTVLGMIEAFKQLAAAGKQVDPSMLSEGIWQALLTTAGGLIVALPALVAWHYFDRRLETTRVYLSDVLLQVEQCYRSGQRK